ncbi:MAG: translation elongation factor Ts [Phycisphaerales bacterium]|nr:translation elongation factor Ts [Phycisphaerales bacterium]
MEITAATVMQLRNKTGLSMMECKKALVEAGGDMDKAEDILRKAMKGKLDAKGDKPSGEGRVAIAMGAKGASLIELRANTDFTTKNESFINLAQRLADAALLAPVGAYTPAAAEQAAIDDLRIKTGETIALARGQHVAGGASVVFGAYVHHDGKTGALARAEGDVTPETLKQVCMHIVAATPTPKGVSATDIPAAIVDRERKFRIEQAMESGKPKEIAEKMVEGGMRKFFEEISLLEQPYVLDPTKKVKDLVGPAKVTNFWRWAVGEQV